MTIQNLQGHYQTAGKPTDLAAAVIGGAVTQLIAPNNAVFVYFYSDVDLAIEITNDPAVPMKPSLASFVIKALTPTIMAVSGDTLNYLYINGRTALSAGFACVFMW